MSVALSKSFIATKKTASRREWLDDEIEHLEIERDLLRSKENIAEGRLIHNDIVMKMLEAKRDYWEPEKSNPTER